MDRFSASPARTLAPSVERGARALARRVRAREGFSLVELMIATFLLSMGVLATAQMFTVADRHSAYSRQETLAIALAREIQEKIMSESFDTVRSVFDDTDTRQDDTIRDPCLDWQTHVQEQLGDLGYGTIQVVTPDDDESLEYGSVAVTVTMAWYEGASIVEMPLRFTIAKIGA